MWRAATWFVALVVGGAVLLSVVFVVAVAGAVWAHDAWWSADENSCRWLDDDDLVALERIEVRSVAPDVENASTYCWDSSGDSLEVRTAWSKSGRSELPFEELVGRAERAGWEHTPG